LVGSASSFFLLFAGFTAPAGATAVRPTQEQVRTAAAWAADRKGAVAWAVVDSSGRIHGRRATRLYASASVSKALLLVAALRRVGDRRPVPPDLAGLLGPMIRTSDNGAARAVYARLGGDAAFRDVARAARLRRLGLRRSWASLGVSAGDVARFFRVADRLVPRRHRPYARGLLEHIHPRQSWGIPVALRPDGWRVLFKGGWRGHRIVHQGALAERDGHRVALAVLTSDNPTHEYGRRTLEGVARRLLGTIAP
jgi:hypothetical protein